MSIALSSAGVLLKYAPEATKGTRPTTGFTTIKGIKSIPDLNPEPSQLETTDLSEIEYRTYIAGLKDTGGALSFGANNHADFQDAWGDVVDAYETASADDKAVWFEIYIPNFKSFYFKGEPVKLGLSGIEVDSVLEINAYVVPSGIEGWGTSST